MTILQRHAAWQRVKHVVAGYSVGEEVYCDLDVSPQTLGALGPKNRDMPNYEDRPYIEEEATRCVRVVCVPA